MAKIPYVNIDKIKDLSKDKGMSMKFFCDHFGKDRTYLSNIRSGKARIDDYELDFIAETLETTVDYLTDKTDQKEKPATSEIDVDELIKTVLSLPREKKEEFAVKFMQMMKEDSDT